MRLEEEENEKENSERWLLTYSDMITLLLVLFIMMFAISSVNSDKFGALSQQLGITFGYGGKIVPFGVSEGVNIDAIENLEQDPAETPKPTPTVHTGLTGEGNGNDMREDLVEMLRLLINSKDLQSEVTVKLEDRGTVVSFQEVLLFPSGSATISDEGREVIEKIADIINSVDNYISVEGSTDNVPISSAKFSSNWELAAQRAINVTKLLIMCGVDSTRVSATSFGEYRPVNENDTDTNKAQNRRVDIVFISKDLNEYQAGYGK